MPDENATTTFEPKVKLRLVDQCQIGVLVLYGFLLVLVLSVVRMSKLSASETGSVLAHMLFGGRSTSHMVITPRNTLPLCLVFCALGCQQALPPSKQQYDKLHLGMPFNEAKRLFAREGKQFDHDKLPVIPLPRLGYKGIPEATTWFMWWDEKTGHPITLGILEGRVIYKEGIWDESGQVKGERETLPEYQK